MKSALVLDLIRAHTNHSDSDFSKTLKQMMDEETEKGNLSLCLELKKAATPRQTFRAEMKPIQHDMGFDRLVSLPRCGYADVAMSATTKDAIDGLIRELAHRKELEKHGFHPATRILLHGPPGCGKTMIAHAIADRLGMAVCTVDFDTLISSLMGQTANNIGRLFEWIRYTYAVLFLDELDAIARFRGNTDDNGESKRIVISLIQNLDRLSDDVVIIAATNTFETIDKAVLRRFQARIEVGLPDLGQREEIIAKCLQSHGMGDSEKWHPLAMLSDGMSGSDLTETVESILKDALMSGRDVDDNGSVFDAYMRRKFGPDYSKVDVIGQLRRMRTSGMKYKEIGAFSGMPQSTVWNHINEG